MTVNELCETLIKDNKFTDETFEEFKNHILSDEIDSFNHPNLRKIMSTINKLPFEDRVQGVIGEFAEKMTNKGVDIPCASSCGEDTCAFHEAEFGNN